ncbi:YkvA family protein [Amycolatopsis sp. CA-161197]|uniref:YkvA family protein n=1 Tax=Amycolatopsis sp. CA-161197 TaxID=3239922 RepID=UPI003D8E39B8
MELVDHWRRCLDNNASCLALPIDPIPDVISVLGYADDAIVVTAVLRAVVRRAGLDTVGAAGRAPTTASTSSMLSWGSAVPGGEGEVVAADRSRPGGHRPRGPLSPVVP